ncbi:hypothetical protein NLG97_g7204 [Lecanicillium saksenae]|uniref:Uncharacterized protein n=1 Tax=Lecanicillium saksenae TaxID=468837 RepID=A0ACC1QNR8_9HYPO|nr:hypothetical protein NLG97_g7204 [Lecanicillium saksenae]
MARTAFIPARDSRHRTAVIALYRALAKTARNVALPGSLDATSRGPNPIQSMLRCRFEKNSRDTSPRLVFAALTAGYKFLSFLDKAQDINSYEHQQIVRNLSSAKQLPLRRPRETTKPGDATRTREPLLIKLSKPGEIPRRRRVPSVAATAEGLPFLRTSSAQPHEMSRMIGRKNKTFQETISKITDLRDELIPEAELEDQWDRLVSQQLRRESLPQEQSSGDLTEHYTWSLYLSRLWLEWKTELVMQDWIARGEALQRIVDQERELADVETCKKRGREFVEEDLEPSTAPANVKGHSYRFMSPPALDRKLAEMEGHDIFSSQAWADVVSSKMGMLRSWASKAKHA